MLDKVFTNNQVTIAGEVVSEFVFSHEVYGLSSPGRPLSMKEKAKNRIRITYFWMAMSARARCIVKRR